ncbi:MAG TPA: hypothetical protein DEB18_17505, partial [Leeuwenhoekiella sp.]|nr:hypothetical protein [Leeuwenhoekiella sp.]
IKASYLFNLNTALGTNSSASENFAQRNYSLETFELNPKISYLFDDNTRLEAFYSLGTKENSLGALEYLNKQDFGVAFSYSNAEKISFNIEAQYIKNEFEGAAFSPVAYQMLEGLQPGSNFTWNVIAQKRLTKFLDLNLSYFGRKSEDSRTIHTGTVQLRALF